MNMTPTPSKPKYRSHRTSRPSPVFVHAQRKGAAVLGEQRSNCLKIAGSWKSGLWGSVLPLEAVRQRLTNSQKDAPAVAWTEMPFGACKNSASSMKIRSEAWVDGRSKRTRRCHLHMWKPVGVHIRHATESQSTVYSSATRPSLLKTERPCSSMAMCAWSTSWFSVEKMHVLK